MHSTVVANISERTQTNISKGNVCTESRAGIQMFLPSGITQSLAVLAVMCTKLHEVLPARKAHLSLGVYGSY